MVCIYVSPRNTCRQPVTFDYLPIGVDYTVLLNAIMSKTAAQRTLEWDGCSFLKGLSMEGYGAPNVLGVGTVTQVSSIRDPFLVLENLGCKQTPGPRAHHAAVVFQERLFIFGGKMNDQQVQINVAQSIYNTSHFMLCNVCIVLC
jgi:hypothetical protein